MAWSNGCGVGAQIIIHGDFNAAVCAASAVVDGGKATQVSVTDVDYQRVVYRWRRGGGIEP